MPFSRVGVIVDPGVVRLIAGIPMSELGAAVGDLPEGREAAMAKFLAYFRAHAAILGDDGLRWDMHLDDVNFAHGHPPDMDNTMTIFTLRFIPSPGASRRPRTLRYDAVIDRVASHHVRVYRFEAGKEVPLGRLQAPVTELRLPD
jgi:hypothetical protein